MNAILYHCKHFSINLFIVLFPLAGVLSAAAVTPKEKALEFFGQPAVYNARSVKVCNLTSVETTAQNLRMFNRDGGGFVIMKKTGEKWSVIGYSTEGSIDVENDSQFSLFSSIISAEKESDVIVAEGALTPGEPVKGPYLKTQWNQGEPYNRYCPYDSIEGKNMWAGCTTAAVAQLFYYYKNFTHTRFHKVQWSKMRETYTVGSYTEDEADAVATFYADIAQYVINARFGNNETAGIIPMFFGEGYTFIEVERNRELDFVKQADSPQLLVFGNYRGSSSHAVVMDGVDSNGYIHINWGWSGSFDGWYDPNYLYVNESRYYYINQNYHAQIFLNPDERYYYPSIKIDGGVTISDSNPKAGDMVTVTLKNLNYVHSDKLDFGFNDSRKNYVSQGLILRLYDEFPWKTGHIANYTSGYVGQIKSSFSTDVLHYDMQNLSGRDVSFTFAMPDIPAGSTMILRPEYYLTWWKSTVEIRKWPEGSYPLGESISYRPFYVSDSDNAEDNGQHSNCIIIRKNQDGSMSCTPASLGNLMYSNKMSSGIDDIESDLHDSGAAEITGYYGVDGIMTKHPRQGLNIVRYSDGTAKKLWYGN